MMRLNVRKMFYSQKNYFVRMFLPTSFVRNCYIFSYNVLHREYLAEGLHLLCIKLTLVQEN